MNILFITNALPPEVDGVGDYTLNLAKEFAKHGHEVSIVCKKSNKVLIDCTEVGIYPIVNKWNKSAAGQVKQLMQQRSVEMVCLQYVPHGFEPHGLPLGLLLFMQELKKAGTPIFTFFHEICIGYSFNVNRLVGAFLMGMIARLIAKKSLIIATSIEHYKKCLNKLGVNKNVAIIPIPSNIPECNLTESEVSKLKKTIASKDEKLITLFGNRDFSQVISAIRNLIKKGERIKVIALGKANRSIPKEHFIYFTGAMEISELSAFLKVTDILILPEDTKSGCSLKSGSLAASLQFGIPTITTRGFMTDKSLDVLFLFAKENSVSEYEHIIAMLLDDLEKRENMRWNNFKFAETLTWKVTYDKYIELILSHKSIN